MTLGKSQSLTTPANSLRLQNFKEDDSLHFVEGVSSPGNPYTNEIIGLFPISVSIPLWCADLPGSVNPMYLQEDHMLAARLPQ